MTEAAYNTDDYFSFNDISCESSCSVNDTNKNELEVLQFLEEMR